MKKIRVLFLICLAACLVSCTPKGIIPKKKLAAIHADMFLFDQYAGADNSMKRFTDTCAVYKPLLRSYGYTADEYYRSVDYYLENIRDMEDVLDMTDKILQKRKKKILKTIEKNSRQVDTTSVPKRPRGKKGKDAAEAAEEDN